MPVFFTSLSGHDIDICIKKFESSLDNYNRYPGLHLSKNLTAKKKKGVGNGRKGERARKKKKTYSKTSGKCKFLPCSLLVSLRNIICLLFAYCINFLIIWEF